MNPLIRKQIQNIEEAIDELGTILRQADEQVREQAAEREALLQDKWRMQKEISALHHASEHYDAVAARNRQLAERHDEIRGRLARLLGRVKALGAEIRT